MGKIHVPQNLDQLSRGFDLEVGKVVYPGFVLCSSRIVHRFTTRIQNTSVLSKLPVPADECFRNDRYDSFTARVFIDVTIKVEGVLVHS